MESRKENWIRTFKDWENSSLTRAEYCRRHSIAISTFDYWRQRIRKESAKQEETVLVKLPVQLSSINPTPMTIEMPSGCKINIPENYESGTLKRLILDMIEVLP